MLTAVAMGWRPDGVFGFLAAFGLLLWLRFALIWLGVWLTTAPDARARIT